MKSEADPANLALVNEQTKNAYDLAAATYHDLFKDELEGKEYDRLLLDRFASHFSAESVLYDLGCGPSGHVAAYLHRKGPQVTGVDISPRCVEMASRNNPGMTFERMDFSRMAPADRSVDGLVSFYSIIHTPKELLGLLLREFRRVLKEKGKILLAVKEGETEGYLDEFLGHETRIYFSHFTVEEVERHLTAGGFRILLLERRAPYGAEISVPRIYAIAERI